jgi:hypothetical protein
MSLRKPFKSSIKVKRKSPKIKKNSRFLEFSILAVFALVVIYGASFALKISNGVSKTIDVPTQAVRLQILNGCGISGAAERVARIIPGLIKPPLEASVVDIYDFKAFNVKKSFLISRQQDLTLAQMAATQLNLDATNIVFDPIENNYKSINITLVLGEDYDKLIALGQK